MCPDGRRHLGNERAWPGIVLYNSCLGMDERPKRRGKRFYSRTRKRPRSLRDNLMSASNASPPRVTMLRPEVDESDSADRNVGARPRLLIVDDLEDNREILMRRFKLRGFDVVEAECGLTAIELIDKHSFDLVLLDVMMPGIDGIETLKRIRSRNSASALPVIMVTAKSESGNIVDALELGANDYVTKPVDFAVALARVNTQISRKRAEEQVTLVNVELRRVNEDLERRVEERTSRLIDANQRLKVEIADREESQAISQYLA